MCSDSRTSEPDADVLQDVEVMCRAAYSILTDYDERDNNVEQTPRR